MRRRVRRFHSITKNFRGRRAVAERGAGNSGVDRPCFEVRPGFRFERGKVIAVNSRGADVLRRAG